MVYRISAKLRTVSYSYLFFRALAALTLRSNAAAFLSTSLLCLCCSLLFIAVHSPCAAGLS